jgi:hypothetical protein
MSKTTETTIPFETVRVPNGDKPEGYEEVISDGVNGKRIVVTDDNGNTVSERVTNARNEIVSYGIKKEGEKQDSLSSGSAGDATVHQENEVVSTPDSPQGETSKDTPEKDETDKDSFVPPITGYSNQSQGGFVKIKGNISMNLKKAALEAGRLLVLAIPGILITVLTNNPELGGSLGATILLVLKSIDRGIHEDPTTKSNGLLPF